MKQTSILSSWPLQLQIHSAKICALQPWLCNHVKNENVVIKCRLACTQQNTKKHLVNWKTAPKIWDSNATRKLNLDTVGKPVTDEAGNLQCGAIFLSWGAPTTFKAWNYLNLRWWGEDRGARKRWGALQKFKKKEQQRNKTKKDYSKMWISLCVSHHTPTDQGRIHNIVSYNRSAVQEHPSSCKKVINIRHSKLSLSLCDCQCQIHDVTFVFNWRAVN